MSKNGQKTVCEYSRFWSTLLYPESANLRLVLERLQVSGIKVVVSPLHDKDLKTEIDINEVAAEPDETVGPDEPGGAARSDDVLYKKPHYHLLLGFNSRKSRQQLFNFFCDLGTVGLECIFDSSLAFQYLTHDNEIDKVKYSKSDLRFINCTELDFLQGDYLLADLIEMIMEEKVYSLNYLFYHLKLLNADSQFDKYLSVIRKNSYLINCLIKENYNHYYERGKTNGTQF